MKLFKSLLTKSFSTKKILSLTLVTILSLGFLNIIHAQTLPQETHTQASSPNEQQNLSKFSLEGLDSDIAALNNLITGAHDEQGNLISQGAIPSTGKVIANLIVDPPVKSGEYIADLLHNTGLAPQAYAQGIGYGALFPILQIWKAFRNMAYFLFIIIFVIVGFMIMLRSQVDHQTVVNFQMAMPKVALTLILITFSYAIAGFVVDLIYLVTFAVISVMATFGVIADASSAQNLIFGYSVFRIGISYLIGYWEFAGQAAHGISSLVAGAFSLPNALAWIGDKLAYLVIAVAILIAMFRTLFALIMAWINIVIAVIFAPLHLLLNALPQFNTAGAWFKGLIANAAVFPAVAIMLLIGIALVGPETAEDLRLRPAERPGYNEAQGWIPPLVTTGGDNTGSDAVRAIVGLGIILLLPEIVKIVHGAFGHEDKMGLGAIAGGNLQAGWSPVSAPFRLISNTATHAIGTAAGTAGGIGAAYVFGKFGGETGRRIGRLFNPHGQPQQVVIVDSSGRPVPSADPAPTNEPTTNPPGRGRPPDS